MTKAIKNNTKDFIWNAIGLSLNAFNSFFFLLAVRFINGLDTAGIFTYAFAVGVFLYAFVLYYNRSYQVSDINNNYTTNDYLTGRVFTSALSIFITAILCIVSHFSIFETIVIFLILLFRIIEAISDCFYGAIQKKNQLYKTGISLSIKAIFGLLSFIVIDYLTSNLHLALLTLILVNILFLFSYDIPNYHKLYQAKIKLSLKKTKKLIKSALPIVIFSTLAIYLSNCQKYILPYYESDEVQAIFGMIIMPATILSLIGSYLINPFINIFTEQHIHKNYSSFINSTKRLLAGMSSIGLIALLCCYLFGVQILGFIFNLDLSTYQIPLTLVILASIFYASTMILSSLLTILNDNRRQTYAYFMAAIVATISSIILIPTFSIGGAVNSFLLSSAVLLIIYIYLLQTKIREVNHV